MHPDKVKAFELHRKLHELGLTEIFHDQGVDFHFYEPEVLTETGKEALAFLLDLLPKFHKGRWGQVFVPLMSKMVPACVELVVVRNHEVLLTHRKDEFFQGWHTPGTYIGPGETFQETAQRCADKEIKCKVRFIKQLATFSHPDSPRFHDVSILILCEIADGEPQACEWFSECPSDLISVHQPYWPVIVENL